MAENSEVQQIVERAVAQVLANQLPKLQAEIVQSVLEVLPAPAAEGASPSASAGAGASSLLQAVGSIHAGTTQKEILRALLHSGSAHCWRIALFVVKAGAASVWQGRGFADDDAVKDFALDISAGPAGHAYQNPTAKPGKIAGKDPRCVEQFMRPR